MRGGASVEREFGVCFVGRDCVVCEEMLPLLGYGKTWNFASRSSRNHASHGSNDIRRPKRAQAQKPYSHNSRRESPEKALTPIIALALEEFILEDICISRYDYYGIKTAEEAMLCYYRSHCIL